MFLSNLSNLGVLEESLCRNLFQTQVQSCILDEMRFLDNKWNEVSINSSNANRTIFENLLIENTSFRRTNLYKSTFYKTCLTNTTFIYDTLISSKWFDCRFKNVSFSQSTMQNARIENCVWENSKVVDFEGINCSIKNSIFENCEFEIASEMGINGFSGGEISRCIFVNCGFQGFPLRGISAHSCIFIDCRGEITDDIQCSSTFGLGDYSGLLKGTELKKRQEGLRLIEVVQ